MTDYIYGFQGFEDVYKKHDSYHYIASKINISHELSEADLPALKSEFIKSLVQIITSKDLYYVYEGKIAWGVKLVLANKNSMDFKSEKNEDANFNNHPLSRNIQMIGNILDNNKDCIRFYYVKNGDHVTYTAELCLKKYEEYVLENTLDSMTNMCRIGCEYE